ncbi:hypothetical protein HOK021_10360 [Streptomyces hygroscopicus]|nr:hypothetical protein HOK021_10360 [Streptomyces hygroscopicus]
MVGVGKQFEDAQPSVEGLGGLCGHDASWVSGGTRTRRAASVPEQRALEAAGRMAPAALRGGAATGRVRERDSSEPVR